MQVHTIPPTEKDIDAAVARLSLMLGYAWGSRFLAAGNDGRLPDARSHGRHADSHCLLRDGGVVVLYRVVNWRRLDRDDIAHTARLAIGIAHDAAANGGEPAVTLAPHFDEELEIAVRAVLAQGSAARDGGVCGLMHPALLAAAGHDPAKTSILRMRLPLG